MLETWRQGVRNVDCPTRILARDIVTGKREVNFSMKLKILK